jgi:hypothetical protein
MYPGVVVRVCVCEGEGEVEREGEGDRDREKERERYIEREGAYWVLMREGERRGEESRREGEN